MPWKVRELMSERMDFVMRLKNGERMTDLCQEFGISRKTGYKFLERFTQAGIGARGRFSSEGSNRPQDVGGSGRAAYSDAESTPHLGRPKAEEGS